MNFLVNLMNRTVISFDNNIMYSYSGLIINMKNVCIDHNEITFNETK